MVLTIDFHINNGTKIAIALDPLTFILSPDYGGEWIAMGTFVQSVLNISPVKTEDAGSNEGLERKFIANGKVDHSE
jgi:hypothetical protein